STDPAPTDLYTLSLHDALPIFAAGCGGKKRPPAVATTAPSGSEGRTTPTEVPPPVESGPDVRPVGSDSARGEEFEVSNPETGERSEEDTSGLQSLTHLLCRLPL